MQNQKTTEDAPFQKTIIRNSVLKLCIRWNKPRLLPCITHLSKSEIFSLCSTQTRETCNGRAPPLPVKNYYSPPSTNENVIPCNVVILRQLDGSMSDIESESDTRLTIQPNIKQDKFTAAADLPAIATYKAQRHEKFSKWFKATLTVNSRIKKPPFSNVICKTSRFENSPISYLTKLLNQNFNK